MSLLDGKIVRKFYLLLLCCFIGLLIQDQSEAQTSQWVDYGQSGMLQYQMDSRGDRLMDFSSAGYKNGQDVPNVAAVIDSSRFVNLAPGAGDDFQRIQDAIDQVSSFSLDANGFRGVVNLTAGEFEVSSQLNINASGVVLQGVGDGTSPASSTILRSTATTGINIIAVDSPNHGFHGLNSVGARVGISDKAVPTGATSFNVADSSQFGVGDEIVVFRQATQQWIDSLGTAATWDATDPRYNHIQERKITRIEGSRVFLDAPIAHNIDSRLVSGEIYRYSDNRTRNVGIQGIRGIATIDESETAVVNGQTVFTDEDHARHFISFGRVRDAWAQNITGQHLIESTVIVNGVSRSVTVQDANSVAPASVVDGGRRYAFEANGGQFLLFRDLESDQGRHDFVTNSTFNGFNRGPNVFFNGTATNSFSNSGAHQNYATGTLLDNIVTDASINSWDRGTNANHGWEGANFVIWNSEADSFKVHNPPGSRNYVIGGVGGINNSGGTGTFDSHGNRIEFNDPENPLNSLYIAQKLELEAFSHIEQREYWVGDFDQLEDDGAADLVSVDAQWLVDIENISQFITDQETIGFDDAGFGTKVPFTINFDLAEGESVVSAFLTIGMNRNGADSSDNDLLFLDNTDSPLTFASDEWGYMEAGETLQVLTLELIGDLAYLQDGQLNGLLTNNRAIDWVHLTVNVGDNADLEPVVSDVELNIGESQRSSVESITVFFEGEVVLADGAVAVVQRSTQTEETFESVANSVSQQFSNGQTMATIQFESHVRNADGALVDGNYQLTLTGSLVTRGGVPMSDDFVFGDVETDQFYSFYGDSDGNRICNVFDLLSFRQSYNTVFGSADYEYSLDFGANGSINIFDLLPFRTRYLTSLPFEFGNQSSSRSKPRSSPRLKR